MQAAHILRVDKAGAVFGFTHFLLQTDNRFIYRMVILDPQLNVTSSKTVSLTRDEKNYIELPRVTTDLVVFRETNRDTRFQVYCRKTMSLISTPDIRKDEDHCPTQVIFLLTDNQVYIKSVTNLQAEVHRITKAGTPELVWSGDGRCKVCSGMNPHIHCDGRLVYTYCPNCWLFSTFHAHNDELASRARFPVSDPRVMFENAVSHGVMSWYDWQGSAIGICIKTGEVLFKSDGETKTLHTSRDYFVITVENGRTIKHQCRKCGATIKEFALPMGQYDYWLTLNHDGLFTYPVESNDVLKIPNGNTPVALLQTAGPSQGQILGLEFGQGMYAVKGDGRGLIRLFKEGGIWRTQTLELTLDHAMVNEFLFGKQRLTKPTLEMTQPDLSQNKRGQDQQTQPDLNHNTRGQEQRTQPTIVPTKPAHEKPKSKLGQTQLAQEDPMSALEQTKKPLCPCAFV